MLLERTKSTYGSRVVRESLLIFKIIIIIWAVTVAVSVAVIKCLQDRLLKIVQKTQGP